MSNRGAGVPQGSWGIAVEAGAQRRPQSASAPKARLDPIEVNPAVHVGDVGDVGDARNARNARDDGSHNPRPHPTQVGQEQNPEATVRVHSSSHELWRQGSETSG
jgi:hypothetical protein